MKAVAAMLAAAPTAVLLFLSTSVPLYLENQEELHHQVDVLAPFAWWCVVSMGVGAMVLMASHRRFVRAFAWAYILVGPWWLLSRFVPAADSVTGLVLLSVAFVGAVVVLTKRARPSSVFALLALFGLVLLGNELTSLVSRLEPPPTPTRLVIDDSGIRDELPNVYHIVLDALQTDVLDVLPHETLAEALRGGIFLEDHTAVYHATVMSLGSMFTSTRYDYDRPRGRFVTRAFGDDSYVRWLRGDGYSTLAIVPASDPISGGVFDEIALHSEFLQRGAASSGGQFRDLWLIAHTPPPIMDAILSGDWLDETRRAELRLVRTGRGLTDAAPIASLASFEALIDDEASLPPRGRYTFVHLLIPHAPYVLDADCSYRAGWRASDPVPQTRCTLDLLARYLERLEALGRFEGSILLIHGDHGAPFRTRSGELVPSRARSLRTPLIVKPPGRARTAPLVRCPGDATLLDLGPTLFDLLKLEAPPWFEGVSRRSDAERCASP